MPHLHHYHRPKTLNEALALGGEPGVALMAGGALALGSVDPSIETFVDLQAVPELRVLEADSGGVQIGGARMLGDLTHQEFLPGALRRSLLRAVPPNVLNNVSVGESFAHRDHPLLCEWMTALAAYDPGVEIALPDGTLQMLNAQSLLFDTQPQHRVIVRLLLPALRENQRFGLASVSRTPSDAALVSAAVFVYLEADGRVRQAVGAVSGASEALPHLVDLDSLHDQPLNEDTIQAAAASVTQQLSGISDYKGSSEYRREMAAVCVKRALTECSEQS